MRSLYGLLLINISIFLVLLILLFVSAEIYFRSKDSSITADQRPPGMWLATYPNARKNQIYELRPGTYDKQTSDAKYRFSVGQSGHRVPNFDAARPVDVAIFGDSFTFGHGVSEGERFSDLLMFRDVGNANIANFGYTAGFTTPHYLFFYKMNKHLKPGLVFVFTYLGNDCVSDLRETKTISDADGGFPQRQIENGYLVGSREHYPRYIQFLSQNSSLFERLFRRLYQSNWGGLFFDREARPNTVNPVEFDQGLVENACYQNLVHLKSMQAECLARNSNCELTNFFIPQDFLVSKDEEKYHTLLDSEQRTGAFKNTKLVSVVLENCRKLGIQCHDLVPLLRGGEEPAYYDLDAHWNKEGHKRVADYLEEKFF